MKKVRAEKEKVHATIQQLQMKNKNLRQEVEQLEADLEDAEVNNDEQRGIRQV